MDESIMENDSAGMQTKPTAGFVQTTTLPAGAKPFEDWAESGSGQNEFTDSDSTIPHIIQLDEMSLEDAEKFCKEFSDLWESTIAISSVPGTYQNSRMMSSTDGSIGRFPDEAEPSEQ